MAVYVLTYDISDDDTRADVAGTLEELRAVRGLGSVWFLRSNKTAKEIKKSFIELIDDGDFLFVSRIRKRATDWGKMEPGTGRTLNQWFEDDV